VTVVLCPGASLLASVSFSPSRAVNRQWLYPYYAIAFLLIVLFLFGCDSESGTAFSVTVQVENAQGESVEGATVGVRPCYDVGEEIACSANEIIAGTRSARVAKAVEVTDWSVQLDDRNAVLSWTTASETDNAGFEIQQKVGEEGAFEQIAFVEGQGTTSESTSYRYRTGALSYAPHTFQLAAVSINGSASIVGEPQTVRAPIDPAIFPVSPNPFRDQSTFGVAVDSVSTLQSTAHTLDGATAQTIVEETVERGRYQFVWAAEDLPGGVYEQRTRIQTGGDVVARDTTYAVLVREAATALGETGDDGTVSTTARTRFPALYDIPPIEVRDAERIVLGRIDVSPTVEFVVTTENDVQTFRRTVAEGENTLTLSISP